MTKKPDLDQAKSAAEAMLVPPTPQSEAIEDVEPKSTSKRKRFLATGLASLVLIASISGIAYAGIIVPNKPEKLFAKALDNLVANVRTGKNIGNFSGSLKLDGAKIPKEFKGVNFSVSQQDEKNVELSFDLNLSIFKPKVEVKVLDTTAYVRVSGFDGVDTLLNTFGSSFDAGRLNGIDPKAIGGLIKALNNNWYEISADSLSALGGGSAITNQSGLDQDQIKQVLNKENLNKILDEFQRHTFLKFSQKLDDEKVDGKDSRHMKIVVDEVALVDFVKAVQALKIKGMEVKDSDVKKVEKYTADNDLSKYPVELWLGKDSKVISQFRYNHIYKKGNVDLQVTAPDSNKEVKVEKPQNSRTLIQLLSDVAPLLTSLQGISGLGNGDSSGGLTLPFTPGTDLITPNNPDSLFQ
jgi:hypothetical protein